MRLWFEAGGYVRVGANGEGHLRPIQVRGVDWGQKEVRRWRLDRMEPVRWVCLELRCHVREAFWRTAAMGRGQTTSRGRIQKVGRRYLLLG